MSPDKHHPALGFADQVGFYMESTGHPRLLGRVLGWLFACDPPLQSAEDMASFLSVSRSAISQATQSLVSLGLIEKVRTPGHRETRYRITKDSIRRYQEEGQRGVTLLRRISAEALAAMTDRGSQANERLQLFHDFHAFIERELPSLMERWEQERASYRR